ncbi:MAG: DUF4860 domain-containing protein [Ruminococcaceae bacterium]|nr:DUF4860 domain-containing protein [Oscillospiraceae bacterium]
MRNSETGKLPIESLLALILFGVFSCCIAFVLLAGVRIYDGVLSRDAASSRERTCVQYLSTRVRQASGEVSVSSFGDTDALVIAEAVEGETYVTRIYCYDGWLYELFGAEAEDFFPADGERILELSAMELTETDRMLSAKLTMPDGRRIDWIHTVGRAGA